MRRLDHTMIFVLIAGTYTPFALLVLHGTLAHVVLIAVWATAGAGTVLNLLWWNAPEAGHRGGLPLHRLDRDPGLPQLWDGDRPGRRRPDRRWAGCSTPPGPSSTRAVVPIPRPAVFGYHEIFHLLVIAAAAFDFAAIAIYALPAG